MGAIIFTDSVEDNLGIPFQYNQRRLERLEAAELNRRVGKVVEERFGGVDEPWPQDETQWSGFFQRRDVGIERQRLETKVKWERMALEESQKKIQKDKDWTILKIKLFIAMFLIIAIPLAACLTGIHFYGVF